MRRDDFVDFFAVSDRHLEIHRRLESWASWVRVRPIGWQVAPMFRQYRSNAWQWERPELRVQASIPEAVEMEKAVSLLPEKHRMAIRFAYVFCGSPGRVCRDLGVSKAGLMELIENGRSMLINRRA
jgi:DNA-directed RNA polymerase specialized sigma24 family protein